MVSPASHLKRQIRSRPVCLAHSSVSAILKNEDRNLVLANAKNQLRAGGLAEVTDLSTDQDEGRILQLRQVEGEGNLARKPGLHGVPIGGNHIDWIGARERRYVLIDEFSDELLLAPAKRQKHRARHQHPDGDGKNWKPQPIAQKRPAWRQAFFYACPKS